MKMKYKIKVIRKEILTYHINADSLESAEDSVLEGVAKPDYIKEDDFFIQSIEGETKEDHDPNN